MFGYNGFGRLTGNENGSVESEATTITPGERASASGRTFEQNVASR